MEQYTVTGMSCAACAARIEKAVSQVQGVTSCSVSLLTNSMGVEGTASPEDIIKAVRHAGYEAAYRKTNQEHSACAMNEHGTQIRTEGEDWGNKETQALMKRLVASGVFLLLLMYVSMGHVMWGWPLPIFLEQNPVAIGLLQILLTTIIMIINQKFFVSGYQSLWHLSPNMDTLVALGSTAAFGYSTGVLFAMTEVLRKGQIAEAQAYLHGLYFESAAMILTLITLGKLLEAYSKGRTTDALKGLMKLAPKTVRLLKHGEEITVPVERVEKDDVFVVRPGEAIPVDGIVLEGNSAIDESSLTGESVPVEKVAKSPVYAGTMNQSGFLQCIATRVGEDTTLSQIIQMVREAATTKAPIARIADKVSGIFVPTVMGIALITILVWIAVGQPLGFALARGISVLVISCPCALGLATPVAIMVGSGVGAKNGILFKTAIALEKTGRVQSVALDKTGTITRGEPGVTDILPSNGIDEGALLSLAYGLEEKSEHPLARAILKKAREEGIIVSQVEEFESLPGNGVMGRLAGERVFGGKFSFVQEQLPIPDVMKKQGERLSEEGKTPLFFGSLDTFYGIIAVSDTLKDDSRQAIRELQEMGLRVVMLTGDNERTAKAIGEKVGVDEVVAGVLPGDKEGVIRQLQKTGPVVMVGDGINDAPALTAADIGMAIGAGADIAIDAADVVLMRSRLSDVASAICLSRATLRNIHENLFWAFLYNTLGIPLAAGVFIPLLGWQLSPMFAAAAMSLSSVSVVSNALRLNLFRPQAGKDKIYEMKKEKETMERTLKIEGMMCGHCEMHVKKALESIEGIETAVVSHEKGTALVTLKEDVSVERLKQAVEEQGYQVTEIL